MPKGLKETSSLITISAGVTQDSANVFKSEKVDVQLNPLDNEVLIIYGLDVDLQQPDSVDATDTRIEGSISTTERTSVGTLADSNVLAHSRAIIQNQTTNAVLSEFSSDSAPATMLEYLGIIATNDFYLNIDGGNNATAKTMNARVYCVRARADSAVYAALVQSEVLS